MAKASSIIEIVKSTLLMLFLDEWWDGMEVNGSLVLSRYDEGIQEDVAQRRGKLLGICNPKSFRVLSMSFSLSVVK
eukprot:CAMPEP_0116137348 /NCGR_PEP_ID=MMETSP0329-20121206/12202_1 /TAXON_ID=697910 /ORGANISM="Pseudo-nitzschia arenysensis, Strain B593" /LENGTH=75 /DNA_ID=CAMNT_0003632261 /DNA_START=489 /DNA_END=717 /DNA_ORIENTATION=+